MIDCGTCRECCLGPRELKVRKGSTRYKTYLEGPYRYLARKDNGDCLYIGPNGCEIYEYRPMECREYDCRKVIGQIASRILVEAIKRT